MNGTTLFRQVRIMGRRSIGAPILILVALLVLILPVPPFVLDVLFTFNITLSLVILLAAINVKRPLDFSIFPTILLLATLLRLALNVASTRVVLLHGHSGPAAAGQVIQAFGEVVIGGNYTVGLVVFVILVIINFVVVTKGAGRISEVSARFTLDAMPGKQMAIDADLNAGIINQEEAKKRRLEVTQEADFYGAMDGASKFVRGDAVAGILILVINILGGVIIGIADHHMAAKDAMQVYSLLTIGDGLVAQIPSLLLSTSAALMVTRMNSEHDMTNMLMQQLLGSPRPLAIAGIVLFAMALIPGMPHLAFSGLAVAAVAAAYWVDQNRVRKELATAPVEMKDIKEKPTRDLDWEDVLPVDRIGLEIGYRLINLVGANQDGQLVSRVKGVRKRISQHLGFLIPAVHIRDNLELPADNYRISLMGVVYAEAEVHVENYLAINPGQVYGRLDGIETRDPTFGLDAVWIKNTQREHAQSLGYTVVDASTVIATHLSHIIQNNAAELLGHEEVQQLLDRLAKTSPKLVEALTPAGGLSLSVIVKVLQRLLKASIPVSDIRTIAENIVEASIKSQDIEHLIATVRIAIRRLIIQTINGEKAALEVVTLDSGLEHLLLESLQLAKKQIGEAKLLIEPNLAERIVSELANQHQANQVINRATILVVSLELRYALEQFLQSTIPGIYVIAYPEIPEDKNVKITATISSKLKD